MIVVCRVSSFSLNYLTNLTNYLIARETFGGFSSQIASRLGCNTIYIMVRVYSIKPFQCSNSLVVSYVHHIITEMTLHLRLECSDQFYLVRVVKTNKKIGLHVK